jgi:hypothetical protein
MQLAVGMWIVAVGYAMVFTGVSWFTDGANSHSLFQNLGLQQVAPKPTPNAAATPAPVSPKTGSIA